MHIKQNQFQKINIRSFCKMFCEQQNENHQNQPKNQPKPTEKQNENHQTMAQCWSGSRRPTCSNDCGDSTSTAGFAWLMPLLPLADDAALEEGVRGRVWRREECARLPAVVMGDGGVANGGGCGSCKGRGGGGRGGHVAHLQQCSAHISSGGSAPDVLKRPPGLVLL